jgi:thiol-disulfide isomerase/thioredoxin
MVKTRKFKKTKAMAKAMRRRKTARRHRASTAGKMMPPLDVRSFKHLKEFEKRIKKGPLTIIMVYADWCGHCHTMAPHFDAASKSPQRSIQSVKVNEQMLDSVNDYMSKNVPQNSKPLSVQGYPSILIVDKNGNKVTDIDAVRDTKTMTELMNKSADIASNAGLTQEEDEPVSPPNQNNIYKSKNFSNNGSANRNKLRNLGLEDPSSLAMGSPLKMNNINANLTNYGNNPKSLNFDSGEEELEGKVNSANELKRENINKNRALNNPTALNASLSANKNANANKKTSNATFANSSELPSLTAAIEPSSDNEMSTASPVPESSQIVEPPKNERDLTISNDLSPNQKLSGGNYKKGGNLMSILSRTTYTLAPAAALIATASFVMKKNKTKKHKRSMRKKSRKQRK